MRIGPDNYNESLYRLRAAVRANSVGGEAHKTAVFFDWTAAVSPAYFYRLRERGPLKTIEGVQRWCFSRDVGSMEKRGEIKRRYISGNRGDRNAVYTISLTQEGRRLLREEKSKTQRYANAKRKTRRLRPF